MHREISGDESHATRALSREKAIDETNDQKRRDARRRDETRQDETRSRQASN